MKRISIVVILLTASAFAQQQAPQPAQPAPQPIPEDAFRIVTRISVVDLPVSFIDQKGQFLSNVKISDVTVTDNGVLQKVALFDETMRPISMVILIDTSSRLSDLIPHLRKSGILFTQLVMGGSGDAAVVTYDHTVDVRQEFTSDADAVEKAFQQLPCQGEDAHLTDGVFRSLDMLKTRPPERRRVIVILGDGLDATGENRRNQALAEAQLANVSIYSVQLSGFKSQDFAEGPEPLSSMPAGAVPHEPGVPNGTNTGASGFSIGGNVSSGTALIRGAMARALTTYSEGTGAEHMSAKNIRAVENAVQAIGRELHSQYWLAYRPNNLGSTPGAAEFHKIVVKVNAKGVTVHNRPGYFYVAPTQ